jgi:hypothetical protein
MRVYTVRDVLQHSGSLLFYKDSCNNRLLTTSSSCLQQFQFHNSNLYLFLAVSLGKFFHFLSERTTKMNISRVSANRYFQGCTKKSRIHHQNYGRHKGEIKHVPYWHSTNIRPQLKNLWSRDSSVSIATRYGLDGPEIESRWGARFSAPVQTSSEAHPASYTMGTGSFPGVKWLGRGIDHPPPYSAEVKGRVKLYVYSPSGPSWPVLGWTLPLPFT